MSRIYAIEQMKREYEKRQEKNNSCRIETPKQTILYKQDVENNINNIFNPIGEKINDLKTNISSAITYGGSTESNFGSVIDYLKKVDSALDYMLTNEIENIKTQITNAVLEVIDEKQTIYQQNDDNIKKIKSDLSNQIANYNKYDGEYNKLNFSIEQQSLTLNQDEIRNQAKKYKINRDNCLLKCENLLKEFSHLNSENEELLNQFLKG